MTTSSRTHTRSYDVIVYGATGFTGRLVAEHLAARTAAGADIRWAMAGRNPDKLAQVAAEIGAADIPLVIADASDPDSLAWMAAATQVVCSTVGPYAVYGEPTVAACVEAGTDYVDLTGEPQFVRAMIDRYHDAAVASGARIVHSCGFDSIPSDLGTMFAQSSMQAQHGVHAHTVALRVKAMKGGASGGTIASMVNIMQEASADPAIAAMLKDPYTLLPAGERVGPHAPDRTSGELDKNFGQWVAPFVMEAINARIVRRSNAIQGYPYSREFLYGEAILVGTGPTGRAKAAAIAAGGVLGALGLANTPVRRLAEKVLPSAGTGPSPEARANGFFDIRILAQHPTDRSKDVTAKVTADRDPGYGATSRMLGEAALTLAMGESHVGGGSWTPASALGDALVTRLIDHAGMTFSIV
jgi:short subunit dehydrogenase-like uncharacterized protein